MNYRKIFVTHVELASHFIKIHGQTNRETALKIEFSVATIMNLFSTYPAPLLNMLDAGSIILVNYGPNYFRGKFVSPAAERAVNVLLIDMGTVVTVELSQIRVLSVCHKVPECIINEPPQANEFILNRCIISSPTYLSSIQDEISFNEIYYNVDHEISNIKLISLQWKNRNYADYLIARNTCNALSPEQQQKYLAPIAQIQKSAQSLRSVTKASIDSGAVRSSINTTGKQMINNHLGLNYNKVPQNMPTYHPRVSPPMDYNSNHTATSQPKAATNIQPDQLTSHHIPTFMSDTLLIGGRHRVHISDVEDGPYMFSIQLQSSEQKMEQMMADIAKCQLQPLSRKPSLGMACIARYSEDNNFYRAVIMAIHRDSCKLLYVDYGNSEKVLHSNIYDIPEQFLRPKTFAVRVSLSELTFLPALSDNVKTLFKDIVHEKILDMVVVPPDNTAFVQSCQLFLNGENMLNRLKDAMTDIPKYIEPTALSDDDFVVIRYVQSPKLFCVQQTKNIVEYNDMMDKLFQHCMNAKSLKKVEIGIACAARFKSDTEWYRAEIVNIIENNACIRFIDYGVDFKTEIDKLKEISNDFLIIPKQAVPCCLLGFDSTQTLSNTLQDQMELLAEDALGERRSFRVKIHGQIGNTVLVNLIDESQVPNMDFSLKMMQLSLPQKMFRQYELQMQNKGPISRPTNAPPANDSVDPNANIIGTNGKAMSDSGFLDGAASSSTSISNWDTAYKHDSQQTSMSSPRRPDFGIEAKDSKFYKNKHYANPSYDSHEQRNSRPATSHVRREKISPEGAIDVNTHIATPSISLNNTLEVKLTWCISPLEFYVSTVESDADLDYTMQMKDIHHFYKNKAPVTKRYEIGSFVISKYSKNNQFHRAKIIDYNEKLNKYKTQLIDLGALTIVDASDIYELDKRFAKLKCFAIKCSLYGVALRKCRQDIESRMEKYMGNKLLRCRFINRKEDEFYVDIEADGINVRDALIRDGYLSTLSADIEIERLIGQTVMAKIVSFKDLSSFQLEIFGCGATFEASYKDFKLSTKPSESKQLPMQITIPVRIDSLLIGKTFSVTPLIDDFGEPPSLPICRLPFFCNNFKVVVMHWESYNIAYVQSVNAGEFAQSMLNGLFDYYTHKGDGLQEFIPNTLCAAKSSDENWYRAEILSDAETNVNVRYLDYGNCELIPKNLVKRLEPQFFDTAALAVKVYLPLKKTYSNKEAALGELVALTTDIVLDLKVLGYHAENWIVDMFNEGNSITTVIKTKSSCKTMTIDELKKHLNEMVVLRKVTQFQNQKIAKEESGAKPIAVKPVFQPQPVTELVPQKVAPIDHPTLQTTKFDSKMASKAKAYISHIDRPDRFYLQIASTTDALDKLQENIQIVAPSLPPLEDFSADTRCIVRYSVDDQWYRAVIIDSDTKITSILFMDYGNTDTITDNSWIKSMNDAFDQINAYAIPCALPLEAKDRNEWSDESCELLKNLVNDEVQFEYVCKGKSNNFVKLYQGERDFMQELIHNGHAIKLDTIKSGDNCFVSHINSISDFYVQMESDCEALEIVAAFLSEWSKFDVMTDIKEGVVCAAKYLDDDLWYRAKIKSHTSDRTEVFFIDYGNSSLTNELRIIPTEVANGPSLAKYCSMVKPKDVQYWSEHAEQRFVELVDNGTIFTVDVVSPGKKSTVDLFVNKKSILDEISSLCDKYSLSALENTLQSNGVAEASETFKATIVDGSPDQFYIQLQSNESELDRIWNLLEPASTWPPLDEVMVGQMCAAFFEENFFRAKIVALNDAGATVHYVDYGNKSICTDLRKLPDNLQNVQPLAMSCSLESKNGIFSSELIQRFANLSRENPYELKYVSKNSKQAVVQLFENGILFEDKLTGISSSTDAAAAAISKTFNASIVEGSPDQFYIQLERDSSLLDEVWVALEPAPTWPILERVVVGEMCAAFFEDSYYRAKISSVSDDGATVHYVDYGNKSFSTDLRILPENLQKIQHLAILCSLESKNGIWSAELIKRFENLSRDHPHEMKFVGKNTNPSIVQLFENGVLFEDRPTEVSKPSEIAKPTEMAKPSEMAKPTDSSENTKFSAYISEMVSPSHFYIQLNNDMEEAMMAASDFPLLDENDKCVGKRCAALWEEAFYRAIILSVDEKGTKVHFIDYGNESYGTDLRKLPDDLEQIDRASILCTLQNENEVFSSDFVNRFVNLDLDNPYEFEFVNRLSELSVVRLYVDGELFSDTTNINSSNLPKNGQNAAERDSSFVNGLIEEIIEQVDRQNLAKETVSDMIEFSLNGTNSEGNSSAANDTATEAERINKDHFDSIRNMGLGTFPP